MFLHIICAFTHKTLYTQTLLHTGAFTRKHSCRDALSQDQTWLFALEPHFVQKSQLLLDQPKSQFYRSSCWLVFILWQRLPPRMVNPNLTSVFSDRPSFRAKKLSLQMLNRISLPQFSRSNLISCERVAFRGASLAPPQREKEREGEKGRERGREGGREGERRCEDLNMWGWYIWYICEDVKMRSCEDVKMICEDDMCRCDDEICKHASM